MEYVIIYMSYDFHVYIHVFIYIFVKAAGNYWRQAQRATGNTGAAGLQTTHGIPKLIISQAIIQTYKDLISKETSYRF